MSRPNVLAIILDGCEDMFTEVWAALREHCNLTIATEESDALRSITTTAYQAILIADGALTTPGKHRNLLSRVVSYAKVDGGTVVCCIGFPNFVRPPDMKTFWKNAWGKPWTSGSYYRSDYTLNPAAIPICHKPGLASCYSMKALSLEGVTTAASRVYLPTEGCKSETPAVFEQVGSGWVGYVGDVNWEGESVDLIMAMCGLVKSDRCFTCRGGKAQGTETLMRCARCKKASYCSKDCQRADWKRHKSVCTAVDTVRSGV